MNNILLLEDDYHLGIILKDQLEMHGYEVSLLRLPREAVANLKAESFDLVIMDKLLSGVDGTEICTQIRNTEAISSTPILMMSGMDGARRVCIAAGANNFIPKPFDVEGLLKSIKETINEERNLKV